MRLSKSFDVLACVSRLENDRLPRVSFKDQLYQLDSMHAGMSIVRDYEIVETVEIAGKSVITICRRVNVEVGIEALEDLSDHVPGRVVVLNQKDSHALIMLVIFAKLAKNPHCAH